MDEDIRFHLNKNIYTHAVEELEPSVRLSLSDFQGDVTVTGHGTGGGIATILAPTLSHTVHRVQCISFGSRRVGDSTYMKWFHAKIENNCRFILANDPIAFLPPRQYRHVSDAVCLYPETNQMETWPDESRDAPDMGQTTIVTLTFRVIINIYFQS